MPEPDFRAELTLPSHLDGIALARSYTRELVTLTIINRHTPAQTTQADLREYADFIRELVSTVQAAKKSGQTVDDAVKSWTTPAKYTGYPAPDAARVQSNAQVIWNETK